MMTRKQTKLWNTKDGRKIRICDMSDNHLVNTMKMLVRYAAKKRLEYVLFYLQCSEPCGEAACDEFYQEQNDIFESDLTRWLPSIYWKMDCDFDRRGIDNICMLDYMHACMNAVAIAKKAGLGNTTVQDLINGRSYPTLKTLNAVLMGLGYPSLPEV